MDVYGCIWMYMDVYGCIWMYRMYRMYRMYMDMSVYVYNGVPAYDYNFLGLQRFTIESSEKLPAGKSTIKFDFEYDGGGVAKGGKGTIYINGKKVGEGRIERTQPRVFSADETADVGIDLATPVVERIGSEKKSKFTGSIPKVTVEVK